MYDYGLVSPADCESVNTTLSICLQNGHSTLVTQSNPSWDSGCLYVGCRFFGNFVPVFCCEILSAGGFLMVLAMHWADALVVNLYFSLEEYVWPRVLLCSAQMKWNADIALSICSAIWLEHLAWLIQCSLHVCMAVCRMWYWKNSWLYFVMTLWVHVVCFFSYGAWDALELRDRYECELKLHTACTK